MNEKGQLHCDDAVAYLASEGYTAANKSGCAVVYLDGEEFAKNAWKILRKIRKQLAAIGYEGSVGVVSKR